MKKLATFVFAGALALGLAVVMCGCKSNRNTIEDFYGIWKRTSRVGYQQVTISADKLVFEDENGNGYILEDLSWAPMKRIKEKDPLGYVHRWNGYKITGRLTSDNDSPNNKVFKADESGDEARPGDIAADWWYIDNHGTLTWGNGVAGTDHGLYLTQFIRLR